MRYKAVQTRDGWEVQQITAKAVKSWPAPSAVVFEAVNLLRGVICHETPAGVAMVYRIKPNWVAPCWVSPALVEQFCPARISAREEREEKQAKAEAIREARSKVRAVKSREAAKVRRRARTVRSAA